MASFVSSGSIFEIFYMEKENKKEKDYHKLEKKLQKPGTTLQEVLQDDAIVEIFRANNLHIHNL